ncbi:unnamed protein product [Sphenostylis stenocarpa]|uniref:Uncharacterized protein n=1 Tax=Sphenostylis stenocarpa TaxID=92480 RepID=A0AA86VE47_9FABA|nr:unnamed protein product [Sphenostylis stenocarpa]
MDLNKEDNKHERKGQNGVYTMHNKVIYLEALIAMLLIATEPVNMRASFGPSPAQTGLRIGQVSTAFFIFQNDTHRSRLSSYEVPVAPCQHRIRCSPFKREISAKFAEEGNQACNRIVGNTKELE